MAKKGASNVGDLYATRGLKGNVTEGACIHRYIHTLEALYVRSRLAEQLKLQIIFHWPNKVCFHIICHQPVLFMYDIYLIYTITI